MNTVLLSLFFVVASAWASPIPEAQLDQLTSDSERASAEQKWCGSYVAKGLVESITFTGKDDVVVVIGGLEFPRKWHAVNGETVILTDKEEWRFVPVGKDGLKGTQGIVDNQVFRRMKKPKKACAPFVVDRKALRNRLCYLSAVAERSAMHLDRAREWYEWCCQMEDGQSCNALGFFAAMRDKDPQKASTYYQKACKLGFGGGCANMADEAYKKKEYETALALYKKGCDLGFKDACFKSSMELMKTLNEP